MSDSEDYNEKYKRRVTARLGRYSARVQGDDAFLANEEEKRKYAINKSRPKKKRKCPTEYQEHTAIVRILRAAGVNLLHPNNNARNNISGKKLQHLGVVAGASDLILFTTPPSRADLKGTCLEIKALDGSPTKLQIDWLNRMKEDGFACFIVWGVDGALEVLKQLGYLRGNPIRSDNHGTRATSKERTKIPQATRRRVSSFQEI